MTFWDPGTSVLNRVGFIVGPSPFSRSAVVRLQGLEIMNDDPGAVDVLYVKVNEVGDKRLIPVCGKVHPFCFLFSLHSLERTDYLLKLFFEAGLTSSQDRGIKVFLLPSIPETSLTVIQQHHATNSNHSCMPHLLILGTEEHLANLGSAKPGERLMPLSFSRSMATLILGSTD